MMTQSLACENEDCHIFSNWKAAGLMIPLFSIRTPLNFGIGEILDLLPFIDWMVAHNLSVLQILPIYEGAPEETSPYKALSSYAFDPVYLSVLNEELFQKDAEIRRLLNSDAVQGDLVEWRTSHTVYFEQIRSLKYRLLLIAFHDFKTNEWDQGTSRAIALQNFIDQKSDWLDNYALFWQLKKRYKWRHWSKWPIPFQSLDPEALSLFKKEESEGILFIKYVQWVLWRQWQTVRQHAKKREVKIMGDIPFLVSRDSADVWSHQDLFDREMSLGAPPDDFSETGQAWGLPLFCWQRMKDTNLSWWRSRIKEANNTYDMVRLDHVVGFFRVWVMPEGEPSFFEPAVQESQVARGKMLLAAIIQEARDCVLFAEDLGCIPDFVRDILFEFRIPGYKVFRWEKKGADYLHPEDYPDLSLATTGTHDTTTLLKWWEGITCDERSILIQMLNRPTPHATENPFVDQARLPDPLHEGIIDLLLGSGSQLVIFPIQDIFLESTQINIPGTVGRDNWSYRLPIDFLSLDKISPYREKLAFLKASIKRHRRDKPVA